MKPCTRGQTAPQKDKNCITKGMQIITMEGNKDDSECVKRVTRKQTNSETVNSENKPVARK